MTFRAEKEFEESKHPRKDDGKFGSGGGGGSSESDKSKTVKSEIHGEGKELSRADLASRQPKDKNGKQGYGGFPLDTINKVHEFSGETGLKAVIFRKNRNGKEVKTYQYTDEHMQKQADYKFGKAAKMAKNIGALRKTIESDSKSNDPKTADSAVVVRLIDTTTIRVGGSDAEKDTGSVGATTLRAEHVIKNSDGSINLKFPGKSHKEWNRRVEGDLAAEIVKRTEGKKPGDKIFGSTAADVNGYLEKASPDKITAKDFRTFHASSMCFDVLSKSAPPPKISAKEADANIKKAIEETSKFLGNTPAICKEKYINPRVIDAYRERVVEGKAA
jgi:DNA topoisomerase IB